MTKKTTAAPLKPSPTTQRKQFDARARILETTLVLVKERGASASTRAICDAAGVTAPTLYHHFKDLDNLYSNVLEHVFLEYWANEPPNEKQDPQGMIDDFWNQLLNIARQEPGIIDLINHQLSTGQIPKIMISTYGRLKKAFEELSKLTPMKVEPAIAAHMCWASTHGLACLIVASKHGIPLPHATAQILNDTLWAGILETPLVKTL